MVEKHIKALLHEHDCVIIPDFGGIITRYASARIHPVKHTLAPPSKRLAFNEKLKLNDGLLVNTIAGKETISRSEAKQHIADFVRNIRADLNKNNKFDFKGIGIFSLNQERKLQFETTDHENYLSDSFGLPELNIRPIQITEKSVLRTAKRPVQEPAIKSENRRFRRFMRKYSGFAASLLIGSLTMSAVYLFSLQADYNLSSLTPIMLNEQTGANYYSGVNQLSVTNLSDEERAAVFAPILPKEAENQQEIVPGPVSTENFSESDVTAEPLEHQEPATIPNLAKDSSRTLIPVVKPVEKEPVKEDKIVVKKEKTKTEKNKEKAHLQSTINEVAGRYYIITDAFNNLQNAEIRLNQILNQGDNGKIIMPGYGSSLHRVSVADFASKDEADKHLNELRKKYGHSIWVLNY